MLLSGICGPIGSEADELRAPSEKEVCTSEAYFEKMSEGISQKMS